MELTLVHVTFSPMRARVTALPWRRDSGMKRTRVPEIWLAFTFSGAVHALAVGDAGVVESAQTFHVDGATGVHTAPQHQAEGFERGLAVGATHGGDEGDLLAKLVHLDRFTHAHSLGMPLGHFFEKRFNKKP